jgi:wyosine [tRNA(Phe)-imidazoG37] synthetase (radical SAM superfamily)
MNKGFIYGPVLSRRLGRSLGIDLIPHKTCSLDCIYCECGKTTNLTLSRKEYIPTIEVKREIQKYLKNKPNLNYITFAGSGEPTLHTGIGDIILYLKNNYPQYKVAVITNSTLLNDNEVIKSILAADLIIPSLDAISQETFVKINQPHKKLHSEKIVLGIKKLREKFAGEIWLEIFIVPGINDNEKELKLFKKILDEVKINKVQLNSLDRPGIVKWLKPVSKSGLKRIANYLGDVEIV